MLLQSACAIAIAYTIGSAPIAYLVGRITKDIDLRERGSGNTGASNVFQSVSKIAVVPVGLAQIAQGLAAVLIARAFGAGEGVQAACGLAAVIANDWNPWLGLTGGRGVGVSIGVLLALSPVALAAFIAISLAGVALRAIPQGVALALLATPFAAAAAGSPAAAIAGCALLAAAAMLKRLMANEWPHADATRPGVWLSRLAFDRDIRDRDAWVRRDLAG